MLELVGHRAAVGLAHPGEGLQQGLAGDADAEDRGGDAGHQLGGEVEALGLDRGVALGLGAERVEAGGEVPVGAVSLQQGGGCLDRLEELLVDLAGAGGGGAGTPSGGAEAEAGWAEAIGAGSTPRSPASAS